MSHPGGGRNFGELRPTMKEMCLQRRPERMNRAYLPNEEQGGRTTATTTKRKEKRRKEKEKKEKNRERNKKTAALKDS